jgi:hypothetical protein
VHGDVIRALLGCPPASTPVRREMPLTAPFSPDTIRWRRAAIVELRKLGIHL